MKKTSFILLLICQFTYIHAGKIKGKLYFSWGYNKEWYTTNNIKINQPSLNNNYMFVKAKGIDKPGWETGIFDKELTIPQYNFRLGYNLNNNWAVELNFDHTKYLTRNFASKAFMKEELLILPLQEIEITCLTS